VVDSSEHSNESLGCIKGGEYTDGRVISVYIHTPCILEASLIRLSHLSCRFVEIKCHVQKDKNYLDAGTSRRGTSQAKKKDIHILTV
jgi:hypothetical protein